MKKDEVLIKLIDYFLFVSSFEHKIISFQPEEVWEGFREESPKIARELLEWVLKDLQSRNCLKFNSQHRFEELMSFYANSEELRFELVEVSALDLYEYKLALSGKIQKSIIRPSALEHIAIDMGDSSNATGLISLLKEAGVPSYFIVYPNTKWKMVNNVLRLLAISTEASDNETLFKIIEEMCHPLRFDGDKGKALEKADYYSSLIQYDGYCLQNFKITKSTDELIREVDMRQMMRKKQGEAEVTKLFGNGNFANVFGSLYGSNNQNNGQAQQVSQQKQETPINIVINNSNIQNNTNNETHRPAQVEEKGENDFEFTDGRNLKYRGKEFGDLTELQVLFCEMMFKENKNYNHKTFDVEEYVYKGDATKNRQEKLKKLVDRINASVKVEFGVEQLFKYGVGFIRRQF